ncbi:MAG: hypothetical protein OEW68_08825 [Gammaproteobacteria bacterium]|nr:hypothetical protein [Gammaproteobacteria bacterium]MDH4314930.1 hypothetical protein [Gammaproteobacteria bacterium]MDH5214189.1 hypothetical protein [Gammaproteobacteria bacterium]
MNKNIGILCKAAMTCVPVLAMTAAMADKAQPFKQTNIHFETNASACDMGIQMSFDTDGVTEVEVENPYGQVVFSLLAVYGMENTSDLTEQFQERVEPPITDLIDALGCEHEAPDEEITLSELLAAWPAGWYEFEGESGEDEFEGKAELTHRVPAGPKIVRPEDGDIVSDSAHLRIKWRKVTEPLVPYLGPVTVVGYHVVVADVTEATLLPGATKTVLDADLSANETSFIVPKQFLEPNRIYEFEVLATEQFGNQTITEGGVFCTPPIEPDECEAP